MNAVIIGAFFIGMIVIGILSRNQIKSTASYFVADRKGSSLFITGSLLATTIGGSSTMGLAGLGYSKGLVGAWWMLVGAIGFAVLSFGFAAKVRQYDSFTLPAMLERQYGGNSVKIIASLLIATAWLGIIAAQIIAAGKILSAVWPGHSNLFMLISGMIIILYTILGGQYSIIRTDFLQSIFIIFGIIICLILGISAAGGIAALASAPIPDSFFSFPVSPDFTWVNLLTFLLFVGTAYLVGPDIYSRIFCAQDAKTATRSIRIAAFIMIPLAFCIALIGITARILLPEIQPENAFPTLIINFIPVGLSGIIIAALLAAVMSSADTCLLTTATIIVMDIVKPGFRLDLSEAALLRISRAAVLLIGLTALLIAVKIKGIIASLLLGYTIYSGGLVIPVLFGFYRKKFNLNACGAIVSIVGGGSLALLFKLTGHSDLLLLSLPVSALLLFTGSAAARIFAKKGELPATFLQSHASKFVPSCSDRMDVD